VKIFWVFFCVTIAGIVAISDGLAQSDRSFNPQRWLEVRSLSGTVLQQYGQTAAPARIGTRLQKPGESLRTGRRSSATLAVDSNFGTIQVAENTILQIERMKIGDRGERLTNLKVITGQVRLNLRKSTNPDTLLQVQTPSGITGVRGTDFGVSVQTSGKTGIATLSGKVEAIAEGKTVAIGDSLQSLVMPKEPPDDPTPLKNDTSLDLQSFSPVEENKVRIVGQVDGVNLVFINNQPISTDRAGKFDATLPSPSKCRLMVSVSTPLGKQQDYNLIFLTEKGQRTDPENCQIYQPAPKGK
jgi:FecR protein